MRDQRFAFKNALSKDYGAIHLNIILHLRDLAILTRFVQSGVFRVRSIFIHGSFS